MAPTVQVPMNFGRQHIGSLTHSNLLLNLPDGRTSRANSLILSFNSPVIERLVSTLEITSLDMDDFQEPSVDCFIDCLYTGEIERLGKPLFREVNKMAKVFDVAWLLGRCSAFFEDLVGESDGYEDMVFLFQEASYVCTALKDRGFINITLEKIGANRGSKKAFLGRFMEDISDLSTRQLDLVVELAGEDLGVVVESLTGKLRDHVTEQGALLPHNVRHFLDTSDLSICRRHDKILFEELFDVLQTVPNDNLGWVFALYRKSNQDNANQVNKVSTVQPKTNLSNLFNSFDRFKDLVFVDLIRRLSIDEEVNKICAGWWFGKTGAIFPFPAWSFISF